MEMTTILFCISASIAAGLFMSRLTKLFGLPSVTAYLIAGIIVGPYCLGKIGIEGLGFTDNVEKFKMISDVALGFIAFSIGNEFRLSHLKKIGGKATFIGICESTIATVVVDIALLIVHFIAPEKLPIPMVLILGAIAAATAPAATIMVVKQYKAKGKVTDLLLPIVAIDDAVGLIVFAISFGVADGIYSGEFNLIGIVLNPLIEIVASLGLGAALGFVFTWAEKCFSSSSKRLSLSLMFVFIAVAISKLEHSFGEIELGFSPLLVCMMMGSLFCNYCDFSADIMEKTERWTQPLLVLFFVLSGAELEFDVFKDTFVIAIGLVYIFARVGGKYLGAFTGTKITHCDKTTSKYLGVALFPQAGVALGMSLMCKDFGDGIGIKVRNIILFSVLIYEIVAPTLTKLALQAAGEITSKPKEQERKHQTAPAKF